jgi:hypothetical protein
MRAKASIPVWARLALTAVLVAAAAACAPSPCATLIHQAERVRAGQARTLESDRWRVEYMRPTGQTLHASRLRTGHFRGNMRTRDVGECLGAEWRGDAEAAPRPGWSSPATVFRRDGWPDIVSFEDVEGEAVTMQVLIERGA